MKTRADNETNTPWPRLPQTDGEVDIPAQPSPHHGERTIRVYVYYPEGRLANVGTSTGVFLSLHNWGGTNYVGTADPHTLADRYDTVAVCVDYLQSGQGAPPEDGHPYDHGCLQAMDALRGLYYVLTGLEAVSVPFDRGRLYATGGSGGANVCLMVNKFAPRTFACIVALSGPGSLTDNVAFGEPGPTSLKAGYSRDPKSPNYLSPDAQQIRDAGHPEHLAEMKRLGNACKFVDVHGTEDGSCPVADKRRAMGAMAAAGLDVEPHYITPDDVDGELFANADHSLGGRTVILTHFGDKYFSPDSRELCRAAGPSDFERREEVCYATEGAQFVISYAAGYPVVEFRAAPE